ncbi:hypothetical protein GCM10027046_20260 [Uliginosibacterium flavum]|uniref:DUF2946 family protein n=1 Tax=Uliginosibacterium flavum TaxID=1396831 RepID=A0ABV2TG08_9RHOO
MHIRVSAASPRILVLAILAVIFHALMPVWMALPMQAGVRMEVCSTMGVRSVFVKFDTPGKDAPVKALQASCPLCLAGAHFALTPSVDAQPALLSGMEHVQASLPVLAALPAPGWPAYISRAPPLFSV